MKIVIDIPKELYEANIKEDLDLNDLWDLRTAVKNGISLSKWHGDLIDRNEAEKIADKMFEHITSPLLNHISTYDAYNIIRLTPTVVEAESEE
jgi:hypothetical protein